MRSALSLIVASIVLSGCIGELGGPSATLTPAAPTTLDDLRLEIGDSGEDSAEVWWYRDGEEVPSLRNRRTIEGTRTAKGQEWRAVVSPRAYLNGRGQVGDVVEVSVVVGNAAPEALELTVSPEEAGSDEALVAMAIGADPDDDALTWRYQWLRDGTEVEGLIEATVPPEQTDHGQVWTVRAWPSDGEAEGEPLEATASIRNAAPVADDVLLGPDPAFEDTVLTATPSGSDLDGDDLDWTFTWFVDDRAVSGVEGDSLTGEHFQHGEQVRVRATPNDGFIDGVPADSLPVTIRNTAPTATGSRIDPAEAREGDVLTCIGEGFEDLDGDPEGWVVVWRVNGYVVHEGPTLTSAYYDRGDVVTCEAAPFDGELTGEGSGATPITVRNTAPVLSGATLTPTVVREGDTITVVLGEATDADSDPITFRYRWTVDGATAGSAPTLTSTSFDRDQVVVCEVTPADGSDDGTPVSTPSVTISNTAPVIASVTLSPASPKTTDTLTATTVASDADGDTITLTHEWYVDGSLVSGATGPTLSSSEFVKGQEIYVIVTPADDADTGTAVTSAAVEAVNTLPTLSSVAISPSTAFEATTLSCVPSGFSDPDGDSPVYAYRWTVDGTTAGTGSTLTGADFDRDDVVQCIVTPSDDEGSGSPVSSTRITIRNTAPVAGGVSLNTLTPKTTSTLTATVTGVSDADGDPVDLTYAWSVDGTTVRTTTTRSTSDTLPTSLFEKGDTVSVTITPKDDADSGTPVTSGSATVQNTAPVISGLTVSPSAPRTRDTVSVSISATDDDGDSLTYTYAWYVDGKVVSTAATLDPSLFVKGQSIYVTVSASDGTDSSPVFTSTTVTSVNTAPTLSGVSISPSSFRVGTSLTCVPSGYSDPDGDSARYSYQWLIDGSAAGTSATLAGSAYTRGQRIQCRVTPSDGTASGSPVTSSSVSALNSLPVVASVGLNTTTPFTDTTLTATATGVSDADGDTVTLTWRWTVGSTVVRTQRTTSTTDTLPTRLYRKTDTVFVTVTPSDGFDTGVARTSPTATVRNSLPTVSSVTLSPSTAYTNTPLSASVSATDADGDSLSYVYAWYLQNEGSGSFAKLTPTGSTLSASSFDRDDNVYVEVTAFDGDGSTGPVRSATRTISNSRPSAPTSVGLSPGSPTPAQNLTCSASGGTDVDGDSLSYRYRWYRGSSLLYTQTTTGASILSASQTRPGDSIRCEVRRFDGSLESSAIRRTVSVRNAASCDEWYRYGSRSSGNYTIATPSGGTRTMYCEMRSDGGWTRLYAADFRSSGCPSGWLRSGEYGGACVVRGPAVRRAAFNNYGIRYSQVRVNVGISQFASMDAVGSASGRSSSLLGYYVDGFGLIYNDGGTWRDVFTVALGLGPGNGSNSCGGASPPRSLRYFYCRSMWGGSSWSSSWSGGFQWNGWAQFPLGRTTSGVLYGNIIANQGYPDEDMAVRHFYLLIK